MVSNGTTLLTSTFFHAIKKLNPKLRIYCGNESKQLAGLYVIENGEIIDICGVDKEYVPAYASFDNGGHVIKSGWRRVFWILLGAKYTTFEQIMKVCPGFFDSRACRADRFVGGVQGDPVENKLLKYSMENNNGDPFGDAMLTKEQILDIAGDIALKDTVAMREEREKDKWFLETWKKRGGDAADKPNI
jgi:hypothetical protein